MKSDLVCFFLSNLIDFIKHEEFFFLYILSYISHRSCVENIRHSSWLCRCNTVVGGDVRALRLSVKIIKQNMQYTQSWPFSQSLEGIVWKDVYGLVKPLRFQGNARDLLSIESIQTTVIYQAWKLTAAAAAAAATWLWNK